MLKLQYSGHLMWRADSLQKTLILGKIEGRRKGGWQRTRWLDVITKFEQAPGDGEGQESPACCSPWGQKESDMTEPTNNNIYSSQFCQQPKCPLTEEWIKKMWYLFTMKYSVQFSSVAQSCPTLCYPMDRSTPGLPVHHHLPEFTQTHVHQVSDAIQPSHPLSSSSPPSPNPSQHQSLFQWVNSSHEVAKALEFQL